jgi:hypothetical protein
VKTAAFTGPELRSSPRLWLALGTLALMVAAPGAIGGNSGREPAPAWPAAGPSAVQVAALTPAGQDLRDEPETRAAWRAAMPVESIGLAARHDASPRHAADHAYLFVDPQEGRKLLVEGGVRADGTGRVLFVRPMAARPGAGSGLFRVRVTTSVDGLVSLSVSADAMQSALTRDGAASSGDGGWALAARSMDEALSSLIDAGRVARANSATERNGQVVLSHQRQAP